MANRDSKVLVIDASIARAAGSGNAEHPAEKKACRDFLEAVLRICHKVAMSPEVREEWKKHERANAKTWRASMVARRKLVPGPCERVPCEKPLLELPWSDRDREALEKDLHLVRTAFAHDRAVVSLDEIVRGLLRKALDTVAGLKPLGWVNPAKDEDAWLPWLEQGARASDRPLGRR